MTTKKDEPSQPPADEADLPLLNDEEFAVMAQCQYESEGKDLDAVRKRRLWERVERELPERARGKRPGTWLGLTALAAGVVLALATLVAKQGGFGRLPGGQGIKGTAIGLPVRLLPYAMNEAAELSPFSGGVLPEHATLVFKVVASAPATVALVEQAAHAGPLVRVVADELKAGVEILLQSRGQAYGHKVEPGEPSTRFCVVAAENLVNLAILEKRFLKDFAELPDEQCVNLAAGGPKP